MKTILLIEDKIEILENLTEYLEMEGYKIIGANNGKEGFDLAKQKLPDLIICDVHMPIMNGHECLKLIVNSNVTNKIPFIFSTSLSENIDQTEALKLGADDYLVKPFELDDLLEKVKHWIKTGSKRDL